MLWLTRDKPNTPAIQELALFAGPRPEWVDDHWTGERFIVGIFEQNVPPEIMPEPGACVRLYTEAEYRKAVGQAAYVVATENGRSLLWAAIYHVSPTDADWLALARAAGLEDKQ